MAVLCLWGWHTSTEKDEGKVVAGNVVTARPIYLVPIALRKSVSGTELLAD